MERLRSEKSKRIPFLHSAYKKLASFLFQFHLQHQLFGFGYMVPAEEALETTLTYDHIYEVAGRNLIAVTILG